MSLCAIPTSLCKTHVTHITNVRTLIKENIDHQWLVEEGSVILDFFSQAFQFSYALAKITDADLRTLFFNKLAMYLVRQLNLADRRFDITKNQQRRFSLRACLYQHIYYNSNTSSNHSWHLQICYCWLITSCYDTTLPDVLNLANSILSILCE